MIAGRNLMGLRKQITHKTYGGVGWRGGWAGRSTKFEGEGARRGF